MYKNKYDSTFLKRIVQFLKTNQRSYNDALNVF